MILDETYTLSNGIEIRARPQDLVHRQRRRRPRREDRLSPHEYRAGVRQRTTPLPRELSLEGVLAGHDPVAGDIGC